LSEEWIFQNDYKSRYKKSKIFQGRWNELCFALWLEEAEWKVANLEAYDTNSNDVEALSAEGIRTAFEVKYIGKYEKLLELGVMANLSGGVVTRSMSAGYSPMDYLLFRLYEAGKKLNSFPGQKIGVAILEDYENFYQTPLEESWTDWKRPRFNEKEQDVAPFLARERGKNPLLDEEVAHYIRGLDAIWIFEPRNWLLVAKQSFVTK
jgi:hypothetical protein